MKERKFLDCMDARRDLYARALHIADLMYYTDKKYYGQWDISREIEKFNIHTDKDGVKMIEIESPIYDTHCGVDETHYAEFPLSWMYTDDDFIVNKLENRKEWRALKKSEYEEFINLKIKDANEKNDRNEYERLKKKFSNE